MTQSVIALVGISGVGKSTLLRSAAKSLKFQHLQASALIKEAKEFQSSVTMPTDDLRTADITDNQSLLVKGFGMARNPNEVLVILDGHTVVDTPSGLVVIEPYVFAALGVTEFIFIADDPEGIHSRRANDQSRNRPQRSDVELVAHQQQALLAAFAAALKLGVPLHVFTPAQSDSLLDIMVQAAKERRSSSG